MPSTGMLVGNSARASFGAGTGADCVVGMAISVGVEIELTETAFDSSLLDGVKLISIAGVAAVGIGHSLKAYC